MKVEARRVQTRGSLVLREKTPQPSADLAFNFTKASRVRWALFFLLIVMRVLVFCFFGGGGGGRMCNLQADSVFFFPRREAQHACSEEKMSAQTQN